MKADYAKRGYHYMKNYGLSKLYLKARDRLERDRLEKNYQSFCLQEDLWKVSCSCSGSIGLPMNR